MAVLAPAVLNVGRISPIVSCTKEVRPFLTLVKEGLVHLKGLVAPEEGVLCLQCAEQAGFVPTTLRLPPALLTSPFNDPQERARALEREIPESPLDEDLLEEIAENGAEFLEEMVTIFTSSARSVFQRLQEAMASADTCMIVILSHDLKGSSSGTQTTQDYPPLPLSHLTASLSSLFTFSE